jgi:hypothetical protein
MYGVEKSHYENRKTPRRFRSSYGIMWDEPFKFGSDPRDKSIHPVTSMEMAAQQMTWLVRRGDSMLPGMREVIEKSIPYHYSGPTLSIPVYEYAHPDDIVPKRFGNGRHGMWSSPLTIITLN